MFTKFSLFISWLMQENASAGNIHIFKIVGLIICIITLFWSFALSVSAYDMYYSKKYIFIRFLIVGLWYHFFWVFLIGNHVKEQKNIWHIYLKMISTNRLLFIGLCIAMILNFIFFILTNIHEEDYDILPFDDNNSKVSTNSTESKTEESPILDSDDEATIETLDSEWAEKETLSDKLYKHFHKHDEDYSSSDNYDDFQEQLDQFDRDFEYYAFDAYDEDENGDVIFDPKLYERYNGYYDPYVDEY
ncbi:MAG: hypothetical protein SPL49_11245 [Oribacterium sp.]|nr:hypothetical protein [Oribacterium sp.]